MADSFNHFADIAALLPGICEQAVTKTAHDIQGNAQALAPVDTGFLKNSIHVEDGENSLEKYVVVGAEYGIFQEYGTVHKPAQRYFTPAVERGRIGLDAAMDLLKQKLESTGQ